MRRASVCSSLAFLLGVASPAQSPKPVKAPLVYLGEISGDPLPAPTLPSVRPKPLGRPPLPPSDESSSQNQQQAKEALRIAGIKWAGATPVLEPPITLTGARLAIQGRGQVNAVNIEQVETFEDGSSQIHLGRNGCYLDVAVTTTPGSAYLLTVDGQTAGSVEEFNKKLLWVLEWSGNRATFGPGLGGFETVFRAQDRRVQLRLSVEGLKKNEFTGHVYSIRVEKVQ